MSSLSSTSAAAFCASKAMTGSLGVGFEEGVAGAAAGVAGWALPVVGVVRTAVGGRKAGEATGAGDA